jgi:hypothetical protein
MIATPAAIINNIPAIRLNLIRKIDVNSVKLRIRKNSISSNKKPRQRTNGASNTYE